jgi:hypothetical protein
MEWNALLHGQPHIPNKPSRSWLFVVIECNDRDLELLESTIANLSRQITVYKYAEVAQLRGRVTFSMLCKLPAVKLFSDRFRWQPCKKTDKIDFGQGELIFKKLEVSRQGARLDIQNFLADIARGATDDELIDKYPALMRKGANVYRAILGLVPTPPDNSG